MKTNQIYKHIQKKDDSFFPSCLILSSLSASKETPTETITHFRDFILSQKNDDWSWNYAVQGSKMALEQHYPNDLDDTACALIALFKTDGIPEYNQALSAFTHHLINAETHEGGPYRTWLGIDKKSEIWKDIDIVVNSNIAYFLGLQEVFLENLNNYIDSIVTSGELKSLYYHSKSSIIYFISRFFSIRKDNIDTTRKLLIGLALQELKSETTPTNPLDTALCISALAHLSACDVIPSTAISLIRSSQKSDGLWPSNNLYIKEIRNGEKLYYGSENLTTAFCLEALALIKYEPKNKNPRAHIEEDFIESVLSHAQKIFTGHAHLFLNTWNNIIKKFKLHDMDKFIILLPYHFQENLRSKPEKNAPDIISLGLANLFGWVGYTIQDDIIDEGFNPQQIPFSNFCIRKSLEIFNELASDKICKDYIKNIFNQIDIGNTKDDIVDRSFGHALGPMIILMKLGYSPDHQVFKSTESYFKHYITVRQMNDDAHDWEEDFNRGQINSASKILFEHMPNKQTPTNDLRKVFWETAIDEIAEKINFHLLQAKINVKKLERVIDPEYLISLLEPLERATQKALDERSKAIDFIQNFNL